MDQLERQERLERKLAKLEAKRKDALERRDPIKYTNLCDALGIEEPELPELYEQGLMEINRQRVIYY